MAQPEMWECRDCGAKWSEKKAKICFGCSSNNIFIYWKPGTVKFDVKDYPVDASLLYHSRPKRKPPKKKKVKKIDKIVKTEVKSKPKSKLISHKQYLRSGKLTDLF